MNVDLAQMQSVVTALGTLDVQTNLVNASAKMGVMEQTMMGIQTQLSTHMGVVGTMENNQNDIVNKIKEIETSKSGSGKHKLLMDWKVWESNTKLTNERTGVRDWKVRFKDSLRQVTRCVGWKAIMEFVETPDVAMGATAEAVETQWDKYTI